LPGRSVWAVTADNRIKVVSAAKSALLASLIVFLLRSKNDPQGLTSVL
jgi:hypothetical protein